MEFQIQYPIYQSCPVALGFTLSGKSFKQKMSNAPKLFFEQSNSHKKIKPIPMVYGKGSQKQFESKFHRTFRSKGYKYVSKLAVVGPYTDINLKRIKQSLKLARNVEFDAYLCDSSGLKPLSEVLKILRRTIKNLNLIIRKADRLNETDILAPQLQRLREMKTVRIEFAAEENIDRYGTRVIGRSLRKCYSVTSLEIKLPFINEFEGSDCEAVSGSFGKLPKLEHVKYTIQTFSAVQEESSHVIPNMHHLKSVYVKSFVKTNWTSMLGGSGDFIVYFMKSLPLILNPINFTHIFHNFAVPTDAFEAMAISLPQLENLRHLFLEFSYCKISELDLIIFAEGMKDCNQIKHLTFKYNENTRIFPEIVCQFVKIIASLEFLEKIDLFFRKLNYTQAERSRIVDTLSKIDNIEFELSKESLYVSRKQKSS